MRMHTDGFIMFAAQVSRRRFRTISNRRRPFRVKAEKGGITYIPSTGTPRHNPRKLVAEYVALFNRYGAAKTTPYAEYRSKSYFVALARAWIKSEGSVEHARELSDSRPVGIDDSIEDLAGFDDSLIGSDGGSRFEKMASGVKRDPRVRRRVLERSKRVCERSGCGDKRGYVGFIDVHHILGAEKSDRVWNCVSLCPNCHREAHFAPNRDLINAQLLSYASQWRSRRARGRLETET